MECNRIGNSVEEIVYENSRFQFKPDEIYTRLIDGANVPILFPMQDTYLSYKPIFFKPPKHSTGQWYATFIRTVVEPVFFSTRGLIERSSTDLYYNEVRREYRLMTSKHYEFMAIDNTQIPGYINYHNEKSLVGRDYIKARRSVYGAPKCPRIY